ncbi:MAG: hypothetical protein MUC62_00985 [Candidatus Thermoplasmatota archaeon]|nr:hypothetical protein [Candidatus Thermoplasmatota archaeon]
MRQLFLLSFDERSDMMVRRTIGLIDGLGYRIRFRTSGSDRYTLIENDMEVVPPAEAGTEVRPEGIGPLQRSLHPLEVRPKQAINPMMLSNSDAELLEHLEEPVTTGDLVLFLCDVFSRESHVLAFTLSERAMAKQALSLCLLHRDDVPLRFDSLDELNKDYLRFNVHFNGVVGLSPLVSGGGVYVELANLVRHLAHFSFRPGLVNLDQADLLVTSKGGTVLVMTYGSERPGGNPAATSAMDALENPLCDVDLTSVRKALVSIIGNDSLSVEDSLVAAEVLKKRIRNDARIIWGVTVVPDPEQEMEVFLVLATTPMELLTHWYSRGV